jgi:hypothetical protein
MRDNINNRMSFSIYAWFNFFIFILFLFFWIIISIRLITGNKGIFQVNSPFFITIMILFFILRLFEIIKRPGFLQAEISFGQILIKTYNPDIKNRLYFFKTLFFNKHLQVHSISRQAFNNYRILIEKSGFRKSLVLQKIENGKLYESKPINISFLGIEKYTALILSIDRLKEKITLN